MNKILLKWLAHERPNLNRSLGWVLLVCTVSLPQLVEGQIRSGGAFLKILPGARSQGMAASLTGSIDEMYAIYANPGAAGFLREWQWSSSYTEWIADVYNLSFMYGRHLKSPWSTKTKLALGIQYQGVREFNSTNQADAFASANDFLVTASFGNPLTLLSKNLSLGTNFKYFRSALDNFSASAVLFDVGLLYRSDRFKFASGPFDYGVISVGTAVNQIGNSLRFISDATPLPRTFRAGVGVNLGKHRGPQVKLTADYRKVRDEKGGLGFGSEVSWNYRVALRGGYNFNDNFLSKFSFGLSFRLDDHSSPVGSVLPGKNNALRVDVAGLEKNEFFSASFLGAANLYPVGPEAFSFVDHGLEEQTRSKDLTLSWQASHDPDLFDEIGYMLLISKSQADQADETELTKVISDVEDNPAKLLEITNQNKSPVFWTITSGFVEDDSEEQVHYTSDQFTEGHYSWTVLAFDQDQHVRFAKQSGSRIKHFQILPILEIADIRFEHDQWITDDEYQGELKITVLNQGKTTARNDILNVRDLVFGKYPAMATNRSENEKNQSSNRQSTDETSVFTWDPVLLDGLRPGSDTTITLKWYTPHQGTHLIAANIRRSGQTAEKPRSNTVKRATFQTIPKGSFGRPVNAVAAIDSVYHYELPFISKIFFGKHSAKINSKKTSLMYSPLETLVNRLEEKSNIKLQLRGYVDATLGESEALIIERAEAVRRELLALGLPDSLIEIPEEIRPGQINHKPNPLNDPDWRWVEQERRYVKITAHKIGEEDKEIVELFHSVPLTLPKSRSLLPVKFLSNINGVVPAKSGRVTLQGENRRTELDNFEFVTEGPDTLTWHHYTEGDQWLNESVDYAVIIEDTLGRKFRTREQSVILRPLHHNFLPDKIIVGVSDFTEDKPSHELYWSRITDSIEERLAYNPHLTFQFVGHACEIGTHAVNDSLSVKRARRFQEQFMSTTAARQPALFDQIEDRLDVSLGRGKREPFSFEIETSNFLFVIRNESQEEYHQISRQISKGQTAIDFPPFILKIENDMVKLVSNNSTTFGRQINRRIEILIKSMPGTKYSTF